VHRDSSYCLESAVRPDSGEVRFVVVNRDGILHAEASAWLQCLADAGRSPNTVREYGRRVAWYLSWCALTMDWRRATLSHLVLWRRTVAASPMPKPNGHSVFRSESTVGLWMVAVRSFYEWAEAHSLLTTDLVLRMAELSISLQAPLEAASAGPSFACSSMSCAASTPVQRNRAGLAMKMRGIDWPSCFCRPGIGS
jgi:hypothetical protein